jgi:hybrid cluster-associated redox disulfide protein
MPTPIFTPQTLVAEILERYPASAAVFVAEGTDCVGCVMEEFCTLKEVSLHYALDLEALIRRLEERGEPGTQTASGTRVPEVPNARLTRARANARRSGQHRRKGSTARG